MIRHNCNNFLVDGGIPRKNGQYTSRMMRCTVNFSGYTPIHRKIISHSLNNYLTLTTLNWVKVVKVIDTMINSDNLLFQLTSGVDGNLRINCLFWTPWSPHYDTL